MKTLLFVYNTSNEITNPIFALITYLLENLGGVIGAGCPKGAVSRISPKDFRDIKISQPPIMLPEMSRWLLQAGEWCRHLSDAGRLVVRIE